MKKKIKYNYYFTFMGMEHIAYLRSILFYLIIYTNIDKSRITVRRCSTAHRCDHKIAGSSQLTFRKETFSVIVILVLYMYTLLNINFFFFFIIEKLEMEHWTPGSCHFRNRWDLQFTITNCFITWNWKRSSWHCSVVICVSCVFAGRYCLWEGGKSETLWIIVC